VVRIAFAAFAERDLDAMLSVCHPDVVLRPYHGTAELTGRSTPYRGYEGIRAYVRGLAEVWKSLTLTPTAFRLAQQSIIVFGRAETRSGTQTKVFDVLWVWRLRDNLVSSVEVFQSAPPDQTHRARTPAAVPPPGSEGRPTADHRSSDAAVALLADKFGGALRAGSNAIF
jgi:ketosteroid isomerase-like protein